MGWIVCDKRRFRILLVGKEKDVPQSSALSLLVSVGAAGSDGGLAIDEELQGSSECLVLYLPFIARLPKCGVVFDEVSKQIW